MRIEADPVVVALEGQAACYARLAKLAEVQHEFVQQGQIEQLLEILEKRREVLGEIGRFEEVIAAAKERWPAFLAGLDSADRARVDASVNETRRLLEEITTADRNDALVLQQQKLNLGRQIHQASAARQVNRNYAAAAAYGARPARLDVKN